MADKIADEVLKDELASLIVAKADKYKEHKSALTERAIDIYYDYIGKVRKEDFDIQKRVQKGKDWRTNIYPKFLKTKALAAWSQSIQSIMSNPNMIEVTAKDETDSESVNNAPNMRDEMNSQFVGIDFSEKLKVGFLEKILYGSMFMEAPALQTVKIKKAIIDAMGTMRNILTGTMAKAYKVTTEDNEFPTVLNRNWFEMYPAPYAADLQTGEGVVHRAFISEYELNDLMSIAGFNKKAIKTVLAEGKTTSPDDDRLQQKTQARNASNTTREGFDLITYHGKILLKDLVQFDKSYSKDASQKTGYIEVKAWVVATGSGGHIIKLSKNLDVAGTRPFYSSVYERVPYELLGVGIGENIHDMAKLIRGAFNLFVDAKKLALPMIGVNSQKKIPGMTFQFSPFKVWEFNGDPKESVFPFNFPDISDGLIPLIELAERYADEITGIPKWTTGQDSKMLNKTATGISMLMNASSQLMRGAIVNLDDYIVEPIATEFYYWNLEHNKRKDIKGIYNISASGLSTLMQKETLNQQLMGLLSFVVNPAVLQNPYALKLLRIVGDNMGIKNVDSVLPKPEDLEKSATMKLQQIQQALGGVSSPEGGMGGQGRIEGGVPLQMGGGM